MTVDGAVRRAVGIAKEGGDTSSARKCTFMELALCLAPGLDQNGIGILYKTAKPALQVILMCASDEDAQAVSVREAEKRDHDEVKIQKNGVEVFDASCVV